MLKKKEFFSVTLTLEIASLINFHNSLSSGKILGQNKWNAFAENKLTEQPI